MKLVPSLILYSAGILLAAVGFTSLKSSEGGIRYDHNPFALRLSGYGKTLARLSQDTVNVVWHLGIEGVNPMGHDHSNCDHDHGSCNHGSGESLPSNGDESIAASEHHHDDEPLVLAQEEVDRLMTAGLDPEQFDCRGCVETVLDSLEKGQKVVMGDLPAIHAFHELADSGEGEIHDHDHDHHGHEHHDHDDDSNEGGKTSEGLVAEAKSWIQDLTASRFERTSGYAMTKAHKAMVGNEIENMLLRAYKMDPTDYGVYNGYFLFLTVHEFRGTPISREKARKVSELTIQMAGREDVDPGPWLTASMALLNLFFLDNHEYETKNEKMPAEQLREYRRRMDYFLHRFSLACERAKAEERWELISEDRRGDMLEREQFARKTSEQFDAMLARIEPSREMPVEGAAAETKETQLSESGGSSKEEGSDL